MSRLRLIVLGSAAGGGVPQWNCRCAVCALARGGHGVRWRTQTSIALSADGEDWALIDCAPEVLAQIGATVPLQPRRELRSSPIASVLLTSGDVDHIAGLLSLREAQPFKLFATPEIQATLRANPVFNVLHPSTVTRQQIELGSSATLVPGIDAKIFSVPGKQALYLDGEHAGIGREGEATIGVEIRSADARVFYIPSCAKMTEVLRFKMVGADLVLFDGTLWHDDEMRTVGVGTKTGRRMGHMSMDGVAGSIRAMADLEIQRKVFIHINNTNPVLIEDSDQRRVVEAAGWEVAYDGMEFEL